MSGRAHDRCRVKLLFWVWGFGLGSGVSGFTAIASNAKGQRFIPITIFLIHSSVADFACERVNKSARCK